MRKRSAADRKWAQEWRAQCRRQLERDLKSRLLYGFVRTYRPVLDDAPFRVFNSMADYREWCEKKLPKYLGYYRIGRKKQELFDSRPGELRRNVARLP